MKILIGQIIHETNTFSNVPTDIAKFKEWDLHYGTDVIQKHRGVRYYLGGMIAACEDNGIEYVPTLSAMALPAGLIPEETYLRLKNELLDAIRNQESFDAIALSLHGAGVVEGIDDMEGDLLQAVRAEVGSNIPIVVSLDLHANLTEQMVSNADITLGNILYPHEDCYEIGYETITLLKQYTESRIKPVTHLINLPLIMPTYTTELSPMKDLNDACAQAEQDEKVLDCTIYHGFPYTDIEQMGVSVLVTTNDDPELAEHTAKQIAREIWNVKEELFVNHPSPEEGLKLALAHEGNPVILNETSDNPGAGTPGDGTYLLRAMLEAKIEKSCFGFMCDPEVANIAHKAGAGTHIDVNLGGKTDDLHGESLKVHAYVKSLTDGKFIQSSPMGRGNQVNLGKSARLIINGVDVLVTSINTQVKDEVFFTLHGIDISEYKVVGLKSSSHFRAGFNPISSKIITVDSPGLSTLDLSVFKITKPKMKCYPFHEVNQLPF